MRNLIMTLLASFTLWACNQKRQDKVLVNDTLQHIVTKPDSMTLRSDSHYFWESGFDEKTNKLTMKRLRPLPVDSLTTGNLVMLMNETYPDIQLEFNRISNDTIFVTLRNSKFLTQQIGSTGADQYMSEVTYNLTELKNINHVHFNFKKGDHAEPGTYARTDFINIEN